MLRSFTGFRGLGAALQVGEVTFILVAKNADELKAIYEMLMEPGTFAKEMSKPSIVINATLLPEPDNLKKEH